jgi:hypothetical protein
MLQSARGLQRTRGRSTWSGEGGGGSAVPLRCGWRWRCSGLLLLLADQLLSFLLFLLLRQQRREFRLYIHLKDNKLNLLQFGKIFTA